MSGEWFIQKLTPSDDSSVSVQAVWAVKISVCKSSPHYRCPRGEFEVRFLNPSAMALPT